MSIVCKNCAKTVQKLCKNYAKTMQKRTCRNDRFSDGFWTFYFYFYFNILLSLIKSKLNIKQFWNFCSFIIFFLKTKQNYYNNSYNIKRRILMFWLQIVIFFKFYLKLEKNGDQRASFLILFVACYQKNVLRTSVLIIISFILAGIWRRE